MLDFSKKLKLFFIKIASFLKTIIWLAQVDPIVWYCTICLRYYMNRWLENYFWARFELENMLNLILCYRLLISAFIFKGVSFIFFSNKLNKNEVIDRLINLCIIVVEGQYNLL